MLVPEFYTSLSSQHLPSSRASDQVCLFGPPPLPSFSASHHWICHWCAVAGSMTCMFSLSPLHNVHVVDSKSTNHSRVRYASKRDKCSKWVKSLTPCFLPCLLAYFLDVPLSSPLQTLSILFPFFKLSFKSKNSNVANSSFPIHCSLGIIGPFVAGSRNIPRLICEAACGMWNCVHIPDLIPKIDHAIWYPMRSCSSENVMLCCLRM